MVSIILLNLPNISFGYFRYVLIKKFNGGVGGGLCLEHKCVQVGQCTCFQVSHHGIDSNMKVYRGCNKQKVNETKELESFF